MSNANGPRCVRHNVGVPKPDEAEEAGLVAAEKDAAESIAAATEARRAAIRKALNAGVSPVTIAQAAGISRSRVYQIVEGA